MPVGVCVPLRVPQSPRTAQDDEGAVGTDAYERREISEIEADEEQQQQQRAAFDEHAQTDASGDAAVDGADGTPGAADQHSDTDSADDGTSSDDGGDSDGSNGSNDNDAAASSADHGAGAAADAGVIDAALFEGDDLEALQLSGQ